MDNVPTNIKVEVTNELIQKMIEMLRTDSDGRNPALLVDNLFVLYDDIHGGAMKTADDESFRNEHLDYMHWCVKIILFFDRYIEKHGLTDKDYNDIKKILDEIKL